MKRAIHSHTFQIALIMAQNISVLLNFDAHFVWPLIFALNSFGAELLVLKRQKARRLVM